MKYLNLTKVTLTLVIATQLIGAEAAFARSSKPKNRSQALTTQVRELSDEEAMEFINEASGAELTTKQLIPPRPPLTEAAGGIVAAGGGGTAPDATPTPTTGKLDGIFLIIDKLIAIGQKIMPTIDKGRAVVTNNSMAAVSVLPRLETKDPVVHDMGGWTIPKTKHYQVLVKNKMGSQVVAFVYSVSFQYNGNYQGKGRYLTGIRASARNINISWGYDLDASSQLIQISNVGSADNVVAGATLEMSYTVKNWTGQNTHNVSFFVAGDGRIIKMD